MNFLQTTVQICSNLFKRALLLLVRVYQLTISPLMANHCRFEPTCSRYALIAIERHGALKGSWLAIRRIGRCHPGSAGGWDPVPEKAPKHSDHGDCGCH